MLHKTMKTGKRLFVRLLFSTVPTGLCAADNDDYVLNLLYKFQICQNYY